MQDFNRDFLEHELPNLQSLTASEESPEDRVEINILAGLAQGKPQIEIKSVMEFVRFNQKPIAQNNISLLIRYV